jgi:glucose/arabinose dehydrogenase/plastocyanin
MKMFEPVFAGSGGTSLTRGRSRMHNTGRAAVILVFATPVLSLAQIPEGDIRVELETIATGLTSPVHLTHAGDGSGRLFIVDQAGPIWIIKEGALLPTPFLDLTSEIPALSTSFDERGVLGMAFHPDYAANGRFFVRYSRPRIGDASEPCFGTSRGCHEEVLAEFTVSADPDVADPVGTILFQVDEPQFNHNAGTVAFGPDGYLYFTLGDGGGAGDGLADDPPSHGPIGNGQDIETALGSMLRIDVDSGTPYAIPPDNPFVDMTGLDEIYAYGFRNPFRFSFDDGPGGDGSLYVADVGQALFEELDIVENGGNYGWVIREGAHCFDPFNPAVPPASCDTTGLIDPIAEYTHEDGGLSIIGGYVYRGSGSPCLEGTYLFGDFSADFGPTGRLYYLTEPMPGQFEILRIQIGFDDQPLGRYLKGMGEDEDGEVYALVSTDLAPTGSTGEVLKIRQLLAGDGDGDCDVDLNDHSAFVSCMGGPDVPFDTDGLSTVDVSVGPGFDFIPADMSIEVGDTVHWFWAGGTHNVESGVGGVHDGNFRSGDPTSSTSTTFDVTFDEAFLAAQPMPGSVYPYYCVVHQGLGMIGSVTVEPDPCAAFDADGDGDVDLFDWILLQASFTGP